jgi:hypothetical protein
VVVRAVRADGEETIAGPGQQNLFVADATE